MKLKKLSFVLLILCSNIYAQLDLDNFQLVNDNYQINNSVIVDINNDGFKDIVSTGILCDRLGQKHSILSWQANDQSGNFSIRNILYKSLDQLNILAFDAKDIDNDGDIDIVFEFDNKINIIKNSYNGIFTNIENFGNSSGEISNLYLEDMNNDSYPDIVYRNDNEIVKIKWNLTNGQFSYSDYTIGTGDIGFTIVDLNNDELLDIVFVNSGYLSFKINAGNRIFKIAPNFYVINDFVFDFGDFNNDNIIDLVMSSSGELFIYYNQWTNLSSPIFDSINKLEIFSGTSSRPIYGLAIADFNNDAFLDIAFTSVDGKLIIQNNNNIDFSNHYAFNGQSGALKVNDINNDGALDLINYVHGQHKLLFVNNSDFNFQLKNYSNNILDANHTLVDINNDGFKDIISYGYGYNASSGHVLQYLVNDGSNNFIRKIIPISTIEAGFKFNTNVEPLVFDVDNDNLKDIIVIIEDNSSTEKVLWIKNLGNDVFDSAINTVNSGFTTVNPNHTKMFYGDFDNDNDIDLFLAYNFIENINGVFQDPVSLDTDQYHSPQLIFTSDNNTVINIIAKKKITQGVTARMSLKWFKYDSQRSPTWSKRIKYYNMENLNGSTCEIINNMNFIDFDNNGLKDIIFKTSCSAVFAEHDFILLKQISSTNFSNPEVLISNTRFLDNGRYSDFDIVDIDKDNDIDIVETTYKQYTNYDSTLSRIHYNNDGVFNEKEVLFSYITENRCENLKIKVSIEDIDNDGILDLLKCNPYEYLITDLSIYDNSLSVENYVYGNKIQIFPNPSDDLINIKSNYEINHMTIYNQLGQIIIKNAKGNTIDISNLNQGLYFLKVVGNSGVINIERIIKD